MFWAGCRCRHATRRLRNAGTVLCPAIRGASAPIIRRAGIGQNPGGIKLIGTNIRAVVLAIPAKSIATLPTKAPGATARTLVAAITTADHQHSATTKASGTVPIEFVEWESRNVPLAIETSRTGV